jgi:hypothetical protein
MKNENMHCIFSKVVQQLLLANCTELLVTKSLVVIFLIGYYCCKFGWQFC